MLYRIATLIQKELLQVRRDVLLIVVLIIGPLIQLSLLAGATGKSIRNLPVAVLDMDRSRSSRGLITELDNMEELRLERYADSLEQLYQWLDAGQIRLAVIIPANFGRDLQARAFPPQIQLIADGTNSIAGSVVLAAAEGAVAAYSMHGLEAARTTGPPISFRSDIRFNPSLNSRNYSIPAMVGLIVFELVIIIASLGLARERETGTLEQLIIMPFQRVELIIGKALPPIFITMLDFIAMMLLTVLVFKVPMRGSVPLLLGLTALYMAVETMWGLLLSTLVRTQQQAVLIVFVQAMLDITFSGYLVPVESLPGALQVVSAIVPLRHYLVIIRGIMLKGATLAVLWPQVLALVALGFGIGTIAILNLGRRLD